MQSINDNFIYWMNDECLHQSFFKLVFSGHKLEGLV